MEGAIPLSTNTQRLKEAFHLCRWIHIHKVEMSQLSIIEEVLKERPIVSYIFNPLFLSQHQIRPCFLRIKKDFYLIINYQLNCLIGEAIGFETNHIQNKRTPLYRQGRASSTRLGLKNSPSVIKTLYEQHQPFILKSSLPVNAGYEELISVQLLFLYPFIKTRGSAREDCIKVLGTKSRNSVATSLSGGRWCLRISLNIKSKPYHLSSWLFIFSRGKSSFAKSELPLSMMALFDAV